MKIIGHRVLSGALVDSKIYEHVFFLQNGLSCVNNHEFQANNQSHGHIEGMVHYNVTIYCTKVHLYMTSSSAKTSFQFFVTIVFHF